MSDQPARPLRGGLSFRPDALPEKRWLIGLGHQSPSGDHRTSSKPCERASVTTIRKKQKAPPMFGRCEFDKTETDSIQKSGEPLTSRPGI